MSRWSNILAELDHIDFALCRESEPGSLSYWLQRRASLLESMSGAGDAPSERAEQVRLAQAVQRGREQLEQWSRQRDGLRAEAGNLHVCRRMVQALRPVRGSYFSIES